MPAPSIFRFAPSPNGELHLGHAYSALMNQRWARRSGGRLLLRMENIDGERCRPVFEAAIEDALAWLGIAWHHRVLRQSERFGVYTAALERLGRLGVLYPCFCARGEIARAVAGRRGWPRDPDGSPLYPGTCRHLDPAERAARLTVGRAAALRLDMSAALARSPDPIAWKEYHEGDAAVSMKADPAAWGDVVLARKTMPASYHLAVVVDDAAQGVTDVVRGEDLLAATSLHRLLQQLLGFPAPRYRHHRLVLDEAGRKLSKSSGAPSLRSCRAAGGTPAAVRAQLGFAEV